MPQVRIIISLLTALLCSIALAHPGGLNSEGCHNEKKTGEYHCHGSGSGKPEPARTAAKTAAKEAETPSQAVPSQRSLPHGCYIGPRGGTYTITKSGKKNYGGC
jgi:hypothetical protein